MNLGFIGCGAVALQALDAMAAAVSAPIERLIVLARPGRQEQVGDALRPLRGQLARDIVVVEALDQLIAFAPAVVAETAGHEAVHQNAAALLAAGVDLLVVSAGALADPAVLAALDAASARGGGRWECCAGAVGGLDILAAARLSGAHDVVYTSRKPPQAWRGTPAQGLVALDTISEPVCFFEGDAAAAAAAYPQNANVAATIALAGVGFARTRVRLVCDPQVQRNVHHIEIRAACASVTIQIEGYPSPDNPKTSLTTGYAVAAHLLARMGVLRGRA